LLNAWTAIAAVVVFLDFMLFIDEPNNSRSHFEVDTR
jgi:hypothetical protein